MAVSTFFISSYLAAHGRVAQALDVRAVEAAIALIGATFEAGRQIITCGNGGSANDARTCTSCSATW